MRCNICGNGNLKSIFSLGNQPLANKYPKNQNEIKNEKLYKMDITFCEECLSCNLPIDVDRKIFFSDYYYLSSVNKELVDHFNELANTLKDKNFILDIGSNDGILLKPLRQLNINCVGVEPSENVGKIANSLGLTTIISFFNKKCANNILSKYGRPDCVVASSVFTHLEDPNFFIEDVKKILSNDGVFIIEVEYLLNILNKMQFERFYFDRPHYYTLTSLKKIFARHDMDIVDVNLIKPHGGSLRIYVKNKTENLKKSDNVFKMLTNEEKKITKNFILKKFDNFKNEINNLKNMLKKFKKNNISVKGYGAPARLATITNFADINNDLIDYIIDDSNLKMNRFSPGKHIPIKPYNSEEYLSNVLLFAYEYFESIKDKVIQKNVKFYQPIPFKKLN